MGSLLRAVAGGVAAVAPQPVAAPHSAIEVLPASGPGSSSDAARQTAPTTTGTPQSPAQQSSQPALPDATSASEFDVELLVCLTDFANHRARALLFFAALASVAVIYIFTWTPFASPTAPLPREPEAYYNTFAVISAVASLAAIGELLAAHRRLVSGPDAHLLRAPLQQGQSMLAVVAAARQALADGRIGAYVLRRKVSLRACELCIIAAATCFVRAFYCPRASFVSAFEVCVAFKTGLLPVQPWVMLAIHAAASGLAFTPPLRVYLATVTAETAFMFGMCQFGLSQTGATIVWSITLYACVGAVLLVGVVSCYSISQTARAQDMCVRAALEAEMRLSAYHAAVRACEAESATKLAAEAAERVTAGTLGFASHELKNATHALAAILADLQARVDIPPAAMEDLGAAADAVRHMHAITTDVLEHQKITSGRLTLTPVPTPLWDALTKLVRSTARAHRRAILLWIDPTLPSSVCADAVRVSQIVLNGLSNACKHATRSTDRVAVRISRIPLSSAVHAIGAVGKVPFIPTGQPVDHQRQSAAPSPPAALPAIPGDHAVALAPHEPVAANGDKCWLPEPTDKPLRVRVDVINESRDGLSGVDTALLFQPFSQGPGPAAIRAAGTGLGLAISRLLARMMGGDAVLEDVGAWAPQWDDAQWIDGGRATSLVRSVAATAGGSMSVALSTSAGDIHSPTGPRSANATSVTAARAAAAHATRELDAVMAGSASRATTTSSGQAASPLSETWARSRSGTEPGTTNSIPPSSAALHHDSREPSSGTTTASSSASCVCTVFRAELLLAEVPPTPIVASARAARADDPAARVEGAHEHERHPPPSSLNAAVAPDDHVQEAHDETVSLLPAGHAEPDSSPVAIVTAQRGDASGARGNGAFDFPPLPLTPHVGSAVNASVSFSAVAILVVDDEAVNRRLLVRMLRSLGCVTIVEATDGEDVMPALDVAAATGTPIDVILLDVVMRYVHGTEAARRVRQAAATGRWRQLPRLVCVSANIPLVTGQQPKHHERQQAAAAGATVASDALVVGATAADAATAAASHGRESGSGSGVPGSGQAVAPPPLAGGASHQGQRMEGDTLTSRPVAINAGSGHGHDENYGAALFDAFLPKPFDKAALRRVLQAVLTSLSAPPG